MLLLSYIAFFYLTFIWFFYNRTSNKFKLDSGSEFYYYILFKQENKRKMIDFYCSCNINYRIVLSVRMFFHFIAFFFPLFTSLSKLLQSTGRQVSFENIQIAICKIQKSVTLKILRIKFFFLICNMKVNNIDINSWLY